MLNPSLYSDMVRTQRPVSANFLSNEYENDLYVVNDTTIRNESSDWVLWYESSLNSHIVQRGETIQQIANRYDVSIERIKHINNLIDDDLLMWQKLYISSLPWFIYVVKEESISLMVFANLYRVDQDELMKSNGQTNELTPYLRGQVIFVPNRSLEDGYALSLLIRPEPKPKPQEIIVSVPRSTNTRITNTIPRATVTSSPSRSSTISSRRYVFQENNTMAQWHCTYYAAHKATFAFPEIKPGVRFRSFGGNANQRLANAKAVWFTTASTPTVGSIAVFSQWGQRYYSYGHVAIVEEVDRDNKRMKVSEMNYAGLWIVTVRWISLDNTMTKTLWGQSLLWFIPHQSLPTWVQQRYDAARR